MNDQEFTKSTKKQKLEMEQVENWDERKCSRLLFIPIRKKMDGYGMSASFGFCGDKWVRFLDFDCFRFIKGGFLKGDFEHGGVVFFLGEDATIGYGNEVKINNEAY
jgi:hypothetical protein